MSDTAVLADRATAILGEMKLSGEIYLEENLVFVSTVSGGKVESAETKEQRGAGIRIYEGGRVGFAHTSDLEPAGIRVAASAARALAEHADPEAANQIPNPVLSALPPPESGDLSLARIETYRKIALARAMEEAARAADPRVTKVRQARYTDVVGRVELRTTSGLACGASFARLYGSIEVVAEQGGESQSGWASDYALKFAGLDPFRIGREAARRAVAKIGGTRPGTRRADLVLDPEVTGHLLEAFHPVLAADSVLKGKSILAGRVGQKVGSAAVSLVDDGRFPGGDRTFPFDAEGIPTRRTSLIEGGVLKGYLHNTYTALKMGLQSTANATRSSYMSPPRIGPTTLYLVPSTSPREEVLAQVEEGFYISEVMGLHTVDPITGEFSLGAAGHGLRRGEILPPVTGVGIAGSILEVLAGIAAVGSDLRLLPGGTAGSTTLVRNLSVSGS